MKYYSEGEMKDLRQAFEEKVLRWPKVTTKKMFGCPCYLAKGKLFAFLVTKGVVITQLDQADKEKLSSKHKTTFFQAGKRTLKKWIRVQVENKKDLEQIMPFVRKNYESVIHEV